MHIYPAAGGNVRYSRDRYRYHGGRARRGTARGASEPSSISL